MKTIKRMQVVVETSEYLKQSALCMDRESQEDFVRFIAENPKAGSIISGTGGARKVRWQSNAHQGKRGGARIIYYFHDENMPIFLFTAYGKNMRENISNDEKSALKMLIKALVKSYRGECDE